jgi:hypothetical protein
MGNVEHVIAQRCILFKICSKEFASAKDFIVMSSIFSHLSCISTKLENKMALQISHCPEGFSIKSVFNRLETIKL